MVPPQQGASTLTQQLIKNNVFEAGGESNIIAKIKRKIQEQYLAINAEKTKPKEEILTDYLNTINLGKGNLGWKPLPNIILASQQRTSPYRNVPF